MPAMVYLGGSRVGRAGVLPVAPVAQCFPKHGYCGHRCFAFQPIVFSPFFFLYADVPFLALVIWAAWAGLRFQQSRHVQWLLIFTVLSLLAYLNRQPGILLFPAMGGWYLLKQRGGIRGWVWAGLSVAVAASAYLLLENTVKPWLGISENYLPVSGQLLQQLREAPGGVLAQLGRQSFKSWVYLGASSECRLAHRAA
jgi:hypothetical protein